MSDTDARDGEGYWAHASWTLSNGKMDNEVGAQTLSVGASMCGIDISTGHMCKCIGGWVQPDVKENDENREGCAPAKLLGHLLIYLHGC